MIRGEYEIMDSAWLLRPEVARELVPPPEATTVGGGSEPGAGAGAVTGAGEGSTGAPSTGGGVRIVEGERRLSHVRVKMRVPWEHWQDIYNEVIDPLAKEGADIICDVNIVAGGDGMIRENTVELGIRESLSQRGIDAQIETS